MVFVSSVSRSGEVANCSLVLLTRLLPERDRLHLIPIAPRFYAKGRANPLGEPRLGGDASRTYGGKGKYGQGMV